VGETARVLDNDEEELDDLVHGEGDEAVVVVQERVAEVDGAVVDNRVEVVHAVDPEAKFEFEDEVPEVEGHVRFVVQEPVLLDLVCGDSPEVDQREVELDRVREVLVLHDLDVRLGDVEARHLVLDVLPGVVELDQAPKELE